MKNLAILSAVLALSALAASCAPSAEAQPRAARTAIAMSDIEHTIESPRGRPMVRVLFQNADGTLSHCRYILTRGLPPGERGLPLGATEPPQCETLPAPG